MENVVTIKIEADTKSFEEEIKQTENYLNKLVASYEKAANMKGKLVPNEKTMANLRKEIEKTNNKLIDLKQKQDALNKSELSKIPQTLSSIGSGVEGITRKVIKWGLAVFGIRSAYMAIRQIAGEVISQDEQLKAQIDYIKWSVGQALKPIIEFIVNLIYKIVAGVGWIIKKLFGINIFSKATSDNFKKANTNAQKLKKTLTGFDEMNILNEDGTVGVASSLMNLSDFDLPSQVENFGTKLRNWFWGTDDPSKQNFGFLLKTTSEELVKNFEFAFKTINKNVIEPYFTTPFLRGINTIKEKTRPMWEPMKNALIDVIENKIKPEWEKLKTFLSSGIETLRPIWEPIKEGFIKAKNRILEIFAPFINAIIDAINYTFGIFGVNLDRIEIKTEETGDEIEDNIGGALNEVKKDAKGLSNEEFNVNINSSSIDNIDLGISNIWNDLKNLTSKTWKVAVKFVSDATSSVGSAFSNAWNQIRKFFGFAKGGIVYHKLPKLASGGIINQPGRGVPIGSAIGGERGMEGVLPLTDSQQMALLGEAIGKYITVNATVINSMNGRVISRELQKVQNDSNFAFNR